MNAMRKNIGGRPLSVLTREMIAHERGLMNAGEYNLSRRAKALGVGIGSLRYHLRPSPSSTTAHRLMRRKLSPPTLGKRLRFLIMAGDQLERQLGIDTPGKREARAIWHKAKKAFRIPT